MIWTARILEAVYKSFKSEAVGSCYAGVIYWNLANLPLQRRDYYWIHFREKQAKRLLRLLEVFFHTENLCSRIHFRTVQKTQFVTYHLVRNLPLEELADLYKYLVDCDIRFRTFTILHFIDRLAKEGLYYKGFILMQCMHAGVRALDTLLCRKAFTLLFSKAGRSGNEEASAEVLKLMLASGLTYNVIMYSTVSNRKVDVVLTVLKKMLDRALNQMNIQLRSCSICIKDPGHHSTTTGYSHGYVEVWQNFTMDGYRNHSCDYVTGPSGKKVPMHS